MKVKYDSWPAPDFESRACPSIMVRVARLTLAVFIALVALASLGSVLSAASLRIEKDHSPVVTASREEGQCTLGATVNAVPTRCRRPTLDVTKQIEPDDPYTGGVVTITFVISGLGLGQVDVVLLQDVSGSMLWGGTPNDQTRLTVAKTAAITFVNALTGADRVAVVAYSETVRSVLPLTTDTGAAIAAIDSLESQEEWYTNIGDGIWGGYEELISSTRYSSGTAKAMVFLSDGGANRPEDDPEGHAREAATAAGECGILIYSVGFSDAVSETLMRDIAAAGGGEYYFSPDGTNLETIYREIALELRNLVITDVLPPGVDLDCELLPEGWGCITGSGYTTITIPISNRALEIDPLVLSFTATLGLDPGYEGPINAQGSEICYDGPGGQACQSFENPPVPVGGRKITGVVFEDLNLDGEWDVDGGEEGLPDKVVSTSVGLRATTNAGGFYVLRTGGEPTLTVTIEPPAGYIVTTPEMTVPPVSGIYSGVHIGLYTGLLPEKHSADINGPPLFAGDTLAYTITARNISTTQQIDSIVITDAVPAFTTYVSGSAHIEPSGKVAIAGTSLTGFFTDTLDPQDGVTLTFRVTVDEDAAGQEIGNQAYITNPAQSCLLSRWDEEGPYRVECFPVPLFNLAASAQVVRPETEIVYTFTVSHTSPIATLTDIVVTDSHMGSVSPIPFSLPPTEPVKELTRTASLNQNRTNTATLAYNVEGYSARLYGSPVTTTVHVIEGISLTQLDTEPSPGYYGDSTTLSGLVVNLDADDGVAGGIVFITDTLGRTFTTTFSDLEPNGTCPFSKDFIVPEDIVTSLTATGWDDIQGALPVSSRATLTLCPEDTYERDFNDDVRGLQVPLISPNGQPQPHDFSGDDDWVGLQIVHGDESLYTFVARPLAPNGVPISLTLYRGEARLADGHNYDDPKLEARCSAVLACTVDVCYRYLKVHSPASGCWTDYELWVERTDWDEPWRLWLPIVFKNH